MIIEFSTKFQKSYKKMIARRPDVAISILQKVLLFSQQPNSPSLLLHKLKGPLNGVYSFSIEKDMRIIVDLSYTGKAIFVDIGSHDEVY